MGRPSTKRANVLLTAGAALLIVGIAVAASVGRSEDKEAAEQTVPVVVARADITAGAAGDDLVSAGKVSVKQVPESEAPADAVSNTSTLAGVVFTRAVAKGDEVTTAAIGPSTLRAASITIPKGKQAVAITVDTTAGGGGYVGAGDHVDLFTVIAPNAPGAPTSPMTKLLLSNIEVLDVSNEIAPRRAPTTTTAATATGEETTPTAPVARSTEGQITLLLALTPKQAEQAIFATSFNRVWFTVLPDEAPTSTTDGVTYEAGYVEVGG
ncbi:MAG: Flp pilus assembly protein CpaB [Aquihabitans sp.]